MAGKKHGGRPAGPTRRRRRWPRRVLIGLAALVALVALAPIWLSLGPAAWIARAQARKRWPGTVEIGSVSVSWSGRITARDVVLHDLTGQPILTADAVEATPRLRSLLSRHVRLGTVRVSNASLGLDLTPDGALDRVFDALRQRATGGDQVDVTADVELVNARVALSLPGGRRPVNATVRKATAKIASLRSPIEARIEGEIAQGVVLVEGSVTLPAGGSFALDRLDGSVRAAAEPNDLAELQPLLAWLGVPLDVGGHGEFAANLSATGGAYEAALQVTDADVAIRLPRAEKPIETHISKAVVSFVGLAEPIVFKVEGTVAQGPVTVRGNVTLPAGGPVSLETVQGTARIEATAASLADLNPALAAAGIPLAVTGRGRLEATAIARSGNLNLTGVFTGQGVTLTGGLLRGDRVDLSQPDVRFDVNYDHRSRLVGEVRLTGAPVEGSVLATVDLAPDTGPRRTRLVAEVHAALPKLAAALPRTVPLREGLVIQDGRLDATLSLDYQGRRLETKGIVTVVDLRGTLDGRPVTLDEPIRAILDASVRLPSTPGTTTSPSGGAEAFAIQVREAEFQSGFATVHGKGTQDDLSLTADCDLAKLDRTLRQFIDLGAVSLAGRGQAAITLKREGADRYAFDVRGIVADLAVTGLGKAPLRERRASARIVGALHLGPAERDVAVSRLTVASSAVSGSGSGTVRGLGGPDPRIENLDLVVTADLPRAVEGLGRLVLPEGVRLAGNVAVHTTGAGSLKALTVKQRITGTALSAAGFEVQGEPVRLRCDELDIEHETVLTRTDGGFRAEVRNWTVKSSLLDGRGSATVARASRVRLERAAAHLDRLDLGLAAEGLGAFLPAGLKVGGDAAGDVTLSRSEAGQYRVKAGLTTAGLAASGRPLQAPWAGGDVAVTFDGEVRREPQTWRVSANHLSARTTDGRFQAATTGETWLRTDGTGRAAGTAAGDLAVLQRLLRPFLKVMPAEQDLALSGAFDGRFAVEVAPGRVRVGTGEVEVRDFAAGGARVGPEPVADPRMRLTVAGAWDRQAGTVELSQAVVRSTLLTADVTKGRVEYTKDGLTSAQATVAAAGDLGPLRKAFGWAVGLPDDVSLAGRATIDSHVSTVGDAIRATGTATIEDAAYGTGDRRIVEKRVDIECDLTYDRRTRSLSVAKAGLRAGSQALVVTGTVADLTGRRRADLAIHLAYDAKELAGKLTGVLPREVAVAGQRRSRIDFRGDLAGATWREVVKGLTARGQLGLDTITCEGLIVRDPTLTLVLADGHLRIGPDRWRINRGVSDLLLDVDLTADPVVVTVPRPLDLARDVDFDKQVASAYLKYLCPAFAEVGHTRGTVTLACRRLRVPLAADWRDRMQAEATAQFGGVELASSKLVRLILIALGERPTGVVGDIPPFTVTARDGRIRYGTIRIPVKDVVIELTGSAGFDETLDLVAAVPLTERMLGGDRRVRRYLTGARLALAIGGTFDNPQLDEQAVRKALDGLIRDALKKAVEVETRRLLERWLDRRRR